MESTKKLVENIPVEISIGGRNTDSHTRGCSWPLFPSFQWTILGYSWNFWAICDQLSMGFFTFLLYKSDYLLIWTFLWLLLQWKSLLLLRFLRNLRTVRGPLYFSSLIFFLYCSACFILSNEKFSFAIFAKSVDFWGAFFNSVLNKYELFQNLLFLVLIRYLLKCSSFCK